jgi:hypothetical protein
MMAPSSSSSRTIALMPFESGTDALARRFASWLLGSTSSSEPSRLRFPVTAASSVEGGAGCSGFCASSVGGCAGCLGFSGISTIFCSVAGLESSEDGSLLQINQSMLPSIIEKRSIPCLDHHIKVDSRRFIIIFYRDKAAILNAHVKQLIRQSIVEFLVIDQSIANQKGDVSAITQFQLKNVMDEMFKGC